MPLPGFHTNNLLFLFLGAEGHVFPQHVVSRLGSYEVCQRNVVEALCFVDYKNSFQCFRKNETHFWNVFLNVMTGPRACLGCLTLLLLLQLSGVGLPPLVAKWNTLPPTTSKSSGTRSHLHYTITCSAATQAAKWSCSIPIGSELWNTVHPDRSYISARSLTTFGIALKPTYPRVCAVVSMARWTFSWHQLALGKQPVCQFAASHVASKCHSKQTCCNLTKMTSPLCWEY